MNGMLSLQACCLAFVYTLSIDSDKAFRHNDPG